MDLLDFTITTYAHMVHVNVVVPKQYSKWKGRKELRFLLLYDRTECEREQFLR